VVKHLIAQHLGRGVNGLPCAVVPSVVGVLGKAHKRCQAFHGLALLVSRKSIKHGAAEGLMARGSAGGIDAAHADNHR